MDFLGVKRFLIGEPFPSSADEHERLDNVRGLAVFASDPISSNAYATEAIMGILVLMGSGALRMTMPVAIGIAALVTIVVFSYIQTIMHYPDGGGAYTVSKDNLGVTPSLIAAGALLTDYVLTVSVSISAGVRAVTSAFPEVYDYRVWLALAAVALITWANLRGVRESGSIFAIPTYAFVFGVLTVIVIGLARYFGWFGAEPIPPHPVYADAAITPLSQVAYIWILLRAFAAGCTALTGIEAISNGIKAFKPPEPVNGVKTMVTMAVMAMSLFLGIAFLSTHIGLVPEEENSILSQMTLAVTGKGFLYYWVQIFTMLILFLAANTGYQDFPRLSSFLARDDFLPRWLTNRGDRLVYSYGIVLLALISSTIIVLFQADEIAMLPLYALGVMLSFTLSQAGMVHLMLRISKLKPGEHLQTKATKIHHEAGWWWKLAANAIGCLVTFIVLIILIITKFLDGAWVIVLAVPLLVVMFKQMNRHYKRVSEGLRTHNLKAEDIQDVADIVLVPIADLHRGSLRAIKYAKNLGKTDVRAVNIDVDPVVKEHILTRWEQFKEVTAGVQLIFIPYDYRDVLEPLIDYIVTVNSEEFPEKAITVVIPEFIPESVMAQTLHNRSAALLRQRLRQYQDIVIIQVPHHL